MNAHLNQNLVEAARGKNLTGCIHLCSWMKRSTVVNVMMVLEQCSAIARFERPGRFIGAPRRFPRSPMRKYRSSSCGPDLHRTTLFLGASMGVLYPEMISIHVGRYGFLEEGLTAFPLRHLRPGMTVLDIEGRFGYFSRLAEFLTRAAGRIPHQRWWQCPYLRANAEHSSGPEKKCRRVSRNYTESSCRSGSPRDTGVDRLWNRLCSN